MSARICVIDRIVITIAIEVQAIDGFGVEVGSVVRADEAAPFGAVISGVAIIQAGIIVDVVTATSIFIVHIFPDTVKKNI